MASFMYVWNTGQTEKRVAILFRTIGHKRDKVIKEFYLKASHVQLALIVIIIAPLLESISLQDSTEADA